MECDVATLRRAVEGRLVLLETHAEIARRDPSPEAVHDFRRYARKLFAAIELHEWAMRPTAHARALALAADAPRGLGRIRDADVALARVRSTAFAQSGLGPFARKLQKNATKGREARAESAARRAEPKRLRAPLLRLIDEAPGDLVADPLRLGATRVAIRAARAARPDAATVEVHGFRREVKMLRDGVEVLVDVAPTVRPLVDECDEVGELLGSWADAGMLEEMASRYVRDEKVGRGAAIVLDLAAREQKAARAAFTKRWNAGAWPRLATLPGALDSAASEARAS